MGIENLFDRCQQMIRLQEDRQRVDCLLGMCVEVDQFFYLYIVGFANDLIALPEQEGKEGKRAGLMFIPAGIASLEADVGASGLALRVDADLFCFFVIDTSHMFHKFDIIGLIAVII